MIVNIVTFLCFLFYNIQSQGILQVDSANNSIIDSQKRQKLFHGANVVVKNFPYHPTLEKFNACNSFVEKDMEIMRDLGQNTIRLGMMWTGVYPQDGFVNNTYLNTMEEIINKAGEHGIYTLIDMHQDLFSEKFCADGVPMWLLEQDPSNYESFASPIQANMTFNEEGFPTDCSLPWSSYYFTHDVCQSFQKLYKNKDQFRDKWAEYWVTVAQKFRGNPYVLGYELINEPWAGDVFKNPLLLIPGNADKWNLQGAYNFLNNQIRKVDPEHAIFFEPVTWLNWFPTGFKTAPGGDQYADRSVFSYHYYQPPDLDMEKTMDQRQKDIQRLGVAGFLTEFYTQASQDGDTIFPPESIELLDKCDSFFQSWQGWLYKPFGGDCPLDSKTTGGWFYGDGQVVPSVAQNVTRSYAQSIAGIGKTMKFDINTGDFQLQYELCIECGETIIYANQDYHYPNGYNIIVKPENSLKIVQNKYHLISFSPNQNNNSIKNGQLIDIQIIKK